MVIKDWQRKRPLGWTTEGIGTRKNTEDRERNDTGLVDQEIYGKIRYVKERNFV